MSRLSGSAALSLADVASDTVAGLWLNIYRCLDGKEAVRGMTVCKTFKSLLPSAVTALNYERAVVTQRTLERFTQTFAALRELHVKQKYDEKSEKLDFSRVHLPELRRLSLYACPLRSIQFNQTNTPRLKFLHMEQTGVHSASAFELDLPEIESLSFEFIDIDDGTGFGRSLSACPKLQEFNSYKLWGLGLGGATNTKHKLVLPECTCLNLYRADGLSHLDVSAPKLQTLNLQACYFLRHVRLHPEVGPPVKVNLINASIGDASLDHLRQHSRVGEANIDHVVEDEEEEYEEFYAEDADLDLDPADLFDGP